MTDTIERSAPVDTIASTVALFAVVALGLAAGAMLTEGAVLVPYWRSLPPEAFFAWYADNAGRLFEFFGPLEIVSALLAIAAALLSLFRRRRSGVPLAAAAVLAVAVLAFFPLYFEDVNGGFEAGTIPLDRLADELARWSAWHWTRTVVGIAAFVAALVGVAVDHRNPDFAGARGGSK